MLDIRTQLYVFWDNNSSFSDISQSMQDYSRNTESLELVSAEDYLYVGFTKPINAFYVELGTANTNANTFTAQYYNGTTWASLSGFLDDTRGLTRSGFVTWTRDQTDEAETTVDSQAAYWYRFKPSADHSAGTTIKGLNIVFSDDQDLKAEVPEIVGTDYIPSGESSHILTHVAARDEIVQKLRNQKNLKLSLSNFKLLDITAFDLLDFFQIRKASTYLTLSKIYLNLSDEPDDVYSVKYQTFKDLAWEAFSVFLLDIDRDNDGKKDYEDQTFQSRVAMIRR